MTERLMTLECIIVQLFYNFSYNNNTTLKLVLLPAGLFRWNIIGCVYVTIASSPDLVDLTPLTLDSRFIEKGLSEWTPPLTIKIYL